MTMTDPIADMLTRIRNANTVGHETVEIPASKMKKSDRGDLKRRRLHYGFRCNRRRQARYDQSYNEIRR